MNNKHSLSDEKVHSLSEEARPLDDGTVTGFVYPHEDEAREKFERRDKKGPSIGGIIGWTFFGLVLAAIVGVSVWAANMSSTVVSPDSSIVSVQNPPILPNTLPQITETTNGKTGREMTVIRDFTGTVVAYKGSSTPVVVFDIGGVQQQYQFRMGNDGKVAVGDTYRVRVSYWHNYWDFSGVEQIK